MSIASWFGRRRANGSDGSRIRHAALAKAVTSACCESLENRTFLTTYSLSITWTGTTPTSAILKKGIATGQVEAWLNTNNTSTPNHTFSNATGMDLLDCGTLANFTVIDTVPANWKPTNDGGFDNGIKVQGGSGTTLRIEAGDDDTLIEVPSSTSSSTVVRVTDTSSNVANTRAGSGIANVEIATNEVAATAYYPSGGTLVQVPHLYGGVNLLVDTGDATYARVTLGIGDTVYNAAVKTGAGHCEINLQDADSDDGTEATVDFGAGTGSGNGLGLGNVLNVRGASLATLAHVGGGSGQLVYDDINVSEGGTLEVAQASTIGDLQVTNGGSATIAADATEVLTFGVAAGGVASVEAETAIGELTLAGTADFIGTSDPSTIDTLDFDVYPGTLNVGGDAGLDVGTLAVSNDGEIGATVNALNTGVMTIESLEVASSAVLNFNLTTDETSMADVTVETVDSPGGIINVKDGGLLTIVEASTIGTLNVDDGEASVLFQKTGSHVTNLVITDGGLVTIQERDVAPTSSAARALIVNSLSFGASSITGTLDLKDNDLIIDHVGTSPIGTWSGTAYTGITGMIASGRNGGSWDGLGINTSSTVTDPDYYMIGVVEATDVLDFQSSSTSVFDSTTVDSTTVLVKFTYGGDAYLNGFIGVDDYGQFDENASTNGALTGWFHGDVDFDGDFDVDDYSVIDHVINVQGDPL